MERKYSSTYPRGGATGIGLVELMIGLSIMFMILGMLSQFLLLSTRHARTVMRRVDAQQSVRMQMDQLLTDSIGADLVMVSYTANGVKYTSNTTDTLILRLPATTASGDIRPNAYDYVIYKVAATKSAGQGPYELRRTVVPNPGGSTRTAESGKLLAQNIQSARFVYVAQPTLTGNGTRTAFTLPVAAWGQGSGAVRAAFVGGVDLCATEKASYSGNTLTFTTAPADGAVVNAQYSVDPTVEIQQGGNAAGQVLITLQVKKPDGMPGEVMEVQSTVRLRNALALP
jgi:Tfp pilus assembly protein PilV